ncbi:hypothetical protein BDW74DRAFT_180338 [Aspergillus multicolor]|uniref:uncharacterized protein n=1 Tax=Aspergillus multicolor TaxID=41759 RepID=UPI003CCCB499
MSTPAHITYDHFAIKKEAAKVAQLLDEDGVPNVLVGWSAIALVGGDFANNDLHFVVLDDKSTLAVNALLTHQTREQQAVRSYEFCREQYHPPGYAHFHMSNDVTLHLHYKSRLLWWIRDEDFRVGPPAQDNPYFVVSTNAARLPACDLPAWPGPIEFMQFMPTGAGDTQGCSGPWLDLCPVKVLLAAAQVKMALLGVCQNLHHYRRLDWFWFSMLYELAERKLPGESVVIKYQLDVPELQAFWDQFRGHVEVADNRNIFEPLLKYRASLLAANKLPHILEGSPRPDDVFVMNKLRVTKSEALCLVNQKIFPWVAYLHPGRPDDGPEVAILAPLTAFRPIGGSISLRLVVLILVCIRPVRPPPTSVAALEDPQLQLFWDQFRGHIDVAADCNVFEPLWAYRRRMFTVNKLPELPKDRMSRRPFLVMTKHHVSEDSAEEYYMRDGKTLPWVMCKRDMSLA